MVVPFLLHLGLRFLDVMLPLVTGLSQKSKQYSGATKDQEQYHTTTVPRFWQGLIALKSC